MHPKKILTLLKSHPQICSPKNCIFTSIYLFAPPQCFWPPSCMLHPKVFFAPPIFFIAEPPTPLHHGPPHIHILRCLNSSQHINKKSQTLEYLIGSVSHPNASNQLKQHQMAIFKLSPRLTGLALLINF